MEMLIIIAAIVVVAVAAIIIVRKKKKPISEEHPEQAATTQEESISSKQPDTSDIKAASKAVEAEKAKMADTLNRLKRELQNAKDELKAHAEDDSSKESKSAFETSQKALQELEAQLLSQNEAINAKCSSLEKEITQLKKNLQDAEEEIEDLEDEANSNKKKLNEEKNKHNATREQLEQSERAVATPKGQVEEKNAEISEKASEIKEKNEAIDFVNEILKAKDADNKDVKEIDKRVNAIYDVFDDDICPTLSNLRIWNKESEDTWENKMWQWCNLQRKTWLQGKKVVAFVGEFSAGKTSIVNRILSQDNDNAPKLPVSSKATTAIATYISYGSDFLSQFTNPSGKLKNISKATFEKVSKDILKKVDASSLISYFVMSYKNNNLRNLSILDTPGFSSNDSEDAKRTAEAIKEADVLFWVFDANSGEINQSSINTIRTHLKGLPLFIVINKADTKSQKELNELESHIRRTVEKNGILVNGYVQFSHKAPVSSLLKLIESIPTGNDKDEIITELQGILSNTKNNLQKEHDAIRGRLKELERQNENYMYYLDKNLKEMEESCNGLYNIPEYTEKLFGSDYYKITLGEWDDFKSYLNNINDLKEEVDALSACIAECTKNVQDCKNELDDKKDELARINAAANKFSKALQDYRKVASSTTTTSTASSKNSTTAPYKSSQTNTNKKQGKTPKELNEEAFIDELINKVCSGKTMAENDVRNLGKRFHLTAGRAVDLAKQAGWGK